MPNLTKGILMGHYSSPRHNLDTKGKNRAEGIPIYSCMSWPSVLSITQQLQYASNSSVLNQNLVAGCYITRPAAPEETWKLFWKPKQGIETIFSIRHWVYRVCHIAAMLSSYLFQFFSYLWILKWSLLFHRYFMDFTLVSFWKIRKKIKATSMLQCIQHCDRWWFLIFEEKSAAVHQCCIDVSSRNRRVFSMTTSIIHQCFQFFPDWGITFSKCFVESIVNTL